MRSNHAIAPDHLLVSTKRKIVAVIDDNPGVRSAIGRLLFALGYASELYASAEEFSDAATMTEAICLLVDIHLGESCGIELVRRLASAGCTTPVIFMTADHHELLKRRAQEAGGIAFLSKPFTAELLLEALTKISLHP
jgi:FixJ family two-component response regulator